MAPWLHLPRPLHCDSRRRGHLAGPGPARPALSGDAWPLVSGPPAEAALLRQLRVTEDGARPPGRRQPRPGSAGLARPGPRWPRASPSPLRPPADSGGDTQGRWPCPRTASPACRPRRELFSRTPPDSVVWGQRGDSDLTAAEASPGTVGAWRPRAGPLPAKLPPPGRGLADRAPLPLPLHRSLGCPSTCPSVRPSVRPSPPPRAPLVQASPGRRGADVGRMS